MLFKGKVLHNYGSSQLFRLQQKFGVVKDEEQLIKTQTI